MAVPKYSETYGAFLQALIDGKEHRLREIVDTVAQIMNVTDDERQEMVPSKAQARFYNNVSWASTYLKKAGLIQSPARGVFSITERGREALETPSIKVDNNYLRQFESFQEFVSAGASAPSAVVADVEEKDTPLEQLENAVLQMNKRLADDLLEEIMNQSPGFFERLVVTLLTKMGYGGTIEDAGSVIGRTGDEGIDGVIREDKLGFDKIYIQAKRWKPTETIGRPGIQTFVGALAGQGATKGLFVTTAKFSKEAVKYAEKQHTTKVVLLDGEELCQLMIDYDLGVSVESSYQIKKIDMDYFEEDTL